jgi:hypothetical protein
MDALRIMPWTGRGEAAGWLRIGEITYSSDEVLEGFEFKPPEHLPGEVFCGRSCLGYLPELLGVY